MNAHSPSHQPTQLITPVFLSLHHHPPGPLHHSSIHKPNGIIIILKARNLSETTRHTALFDIRLRKGTIKNRREKESKTTSQDSEQFWTMTGVDACCSSKRGWLAGGQITKTPTEFNSVCFLFFVSSSLPWYDTQYLLWLLADDMVTLPRISLYSVTVAANSVQCLTICRLRLLGQSGPRCEAVGQWRTRA
jgi:hypothetical protein